MSDCRAGGNDGQSIEAVEERARWRRCYSAASAAVAATRFQALPHISLFRPRYVAVIH